MGKIDIVLKKNGTNRVGAQTHNNFLKGDKGDKGDTGAQGIQGIQGVQGEPGVDGYTPVKGVDYFTEEDIAEVRAGMQEAITSSNKLLSDLVDDTEQTNKFVTASDKTNWNAKVGKTDYATGSTGGVIKLATAFATNVNGSGQLIAEKISQSDYSRLSQYAIIGKGTLENALATKGYQTATDNTLQTTNKTIPTAINEVNSIAKGANQALSYASYEAMVTAFNALEGTEYNVGQNVLIVTTEVPDLWISSIESTSSTYTYTTDAAIVSALDTNGYIQVGYYKLSMLETQKVDLTGYQELIDSSHKLSADLVDDTSTTNKFVTASDKTTWNGKQDALVSGTNIKTINNESLLGSGNITIQGGGGSSTDVQINGTSIVSSDVANIITKTAYNASTNPIATESDLPDISGKQDVIDSSHKLSADLVDDTSTTNKFFSGNYNDLTNKPSLATVATSGSYNDLINKGNTKVYWGYTSTLTASKTVTCPGFVLEEGAVIYIRFGSVLGSSTSKISSLNINGTGTKDVVFPTGTSKQSETPKGYYAGFTSEGEIIAFMYNGSKYVPLKGGLATTDRYGVTTLSSSTSSTSEEIAATPYAVKQAYDLANGKQDALVSGTNIKTINNESILGNGNITIETEPDTRVVVPETTSFGNMSTATQSSRTDLGTFWVTSSNSSMAKIRGKKLNSITLKTDTAGTLTMRGYNSDIDGHLDNNALNTAAQTANQNGYDICTINLVLGEATYLFDGTDNRVTIISQSAINSCPNIIGFVKSGDNAIFKYNNDGFSADDFVHFVWYRSSTPNYSKASSLALNINYNELEDVAPEPVGSMKLFAGTTVPNTWLLCDGSAVSRATYTDLFNVIGTTYGSGDGSTTFNLPDMRGNVPVGYKSGDADFGTLGNTGGEKTHALTLSEIPSNNISTANTGSNTDGYVARAGYTATGSYNFGGQGQAHNNLQPYTVVNYIIKAIGTIGTIETENAQVIDNLTSTSSTDALSANQGRTLNEKVSGTVLYDNSSGANDNIALSDSLSNYTRIKIYSKVVLSSYTSNVVSEFQAVVGNNISINNMRMNTDSVWMNDCATYTLNSNSITKFSEADVRISEGNAAGFNKNTTRTLITKVIGFID